jgi:hypothetical protein
MPGWIKQLFPTLRPAFYVPDGWHKQIAKTLKITRDIDPYVVDRQEFLELAPPRTNTSFGIEVSLDGLALKLYADDLTHSIELLETADSTAPEYFVITGADRLIYAPTYWCKEMLETIRENQSTWVAEADKHYAVLYRENKIVSTQTADA